MAKIVLEDGALPSTALVFASGCVYSEGTECCLESERNISTSRPAPHKALAGESFLFPSPFLCICVCVCVLSSCSHCVILLHKDNMCFSPKLKVTGVPGSSIPSCIPLLLSRPGAGDTWPPGSSSEAESRIHQQVGYCTLCPRRVCLHTPVNL